MIVTGQVAGLALAYGLHLFHGTRNHVGYACDRSHRVYNANYGHECKVDLRTILKTIFGDNFEYNCKNFFCFLRLVWRLLWGEWWWWCRYTAGTGLDSDGSKFEVNSISIWYSWSQNSMQICVFTGFCQFLPLLPLRACETKNKGFSTNTREEYLTLKPTFVSALPFHCNVQCNSNPWKTDIWQVCVHLIFLPRAKGRGKKNS